MSRKYLWCLVLPTVLLSACGRTESQSTMADAMRACLDSGRTKGQLSCPRPILNVSNLRRSQKYFLQRLGFKLDWEWGDPADFASVSRGHTVLFMCEECQSSPGMWLMTFVDDVDTLHRELQGRRAKIRLKPTDMPWGMREMHVEDLDGNVLRIGGPIP